MYVSNYDGVIGGTVYIKASYQVMIDHWMPLKWPVWVFVV